MTEHRTDVQETAGPMWRAVCSCGWKGEWHAWSDEAVLDAEDHEE